MTKWLTFDKREKRHLRIRKRVRGIAEAPRLSVYRSLNNIYAQLIDDVSGKTLLSLSTLSKDMKDALRKDAGNVKGASKLGAALAEACKKKGITKVVFDRSGYAYHGRVKAMAEAARKGGLKF